MDHAKVGPAKDYYNPRETAGIFSIVTFFYNIPILKQGRKADIEEKDIYKVIPEYGAELLGDQLETQWRQEKKQQKHPSIIKCLVKCFGWTYLNLAVIQLLLTTFTILATPTVLYKFVAYFKQNQTSVTTKDIYKYASALIGLNIFNSLYTNNIAQLIAEYSIKVRTSVCSLIYRKALRISPLAFSECSIGKVVSMISKDVFALDSGLQHLKDMLISFLQLAAVAFILYQKVRFSAFYVIGVIIVIIPVQMFVGKLTATKRIKCSKRTDERFKLLQQTLGAIKIIKMYTWQGYFEKLIHQARLKETDKIKAVYYLKVIVAVLGASTINLAFYVFLISYISRGYSVEAETVYFVLSCLGAIKLSIALHIPFGITQTADMIATFKRIQQFLDAEEVQKRRTITPLSQSPSLHLNEVKVLIHGKEVLDSVSLDLKQGLLLVTGNIGSGKSSLLKTILGEYPIFQGDMIIHGTLSYASAEPWLFPSTIRQNILFGLPYDEKRYQEVLQVCALTYDINQFEKLDQTIVGDKGFNLSKGQQARISLARAIYRDSDIYLLDDCLSSLDNYVNKHIFNECIKGFLKHKLCIFVTNNINHIKTVNNSQILFIESGKTLNLEQQMDALDKRITYYIDEDVDEAWKRVSKLIRIPEDEEVAEEDFKETDFLLQPNGGVAGKSLLNLDNLYQEEKKDGKVLWSNYTRYYKYLGGALVMAYMLLIFMVTQFCISYSEKVISLWVDVEQNITQLTINNQTDREEFKQIMATREHFLNIYTILLAGLIACMITRTYSSFYFCMNAARKMHKAMIKSMLNAYMYFFDNHFIGNIINRLSKDFGVTDEHMPYLLFDCCRLILNIIGAFALVGSVNWVFFIPAALLLVKMYFVRRMYLPTGRSLKRLEASTRSPIIGYLNSTLEGLAIVRASEQQNTLKEEFDRHQDLFTSTFYMSQCTTQLFKFLIDILGSFFTAGIVFKLVFFPQGVSAGDAGLALSQAMLLSGLVQFAIRQLTEVENAMTAVERILEYSDVQVEPKQGKILEKWPTKGAIRYNNVSLVYKSDGHTVLKNISFEIGSGEKVGIVGRTGAGKSSIISTLFRLYNFDGQIFIDDENINEISLDCLRSSIGIIPQDPILFSGSIRSNIDPLNRHSDADIWKVLEQAHLKPLVNDLNQQVNDCVASYSSGQKQLICLARALIQNNKIIILDEATANLDPETDQLLQKTVKESFQNCTVLTIAHRLHTVMDCDRILVLDAGSIVEFDQPAILLENNNGFLARMAQDELSTNVK